MHWVKFLFCIFYFSLPLVRADSFVDQTGQSFEISSPERIITLAPSLGEMVADFFDGEVSKVIAVSEFSDFPSSLQSKPTIGPYSKFNVEKVASLKPDLVLATTDGNAKTQIERLRHLGLRVVVVSTSNFDEIENSFRVMGSALNRARIGEKKANQFRKQVKKIQKRARRNISPEKVMVQIGDTPLVVAGKKSFLHEVLISLGAKNLYSDLESPYPRPSREDVIQRNPEMILVFTLGTDRKTYEKMADRWKVFSSLSAVRKNQIHVVDGNLILRPTLRLIEGLKTLEKVIYAAKR